MRISLQTCTRGEESLRWSVLGLHGAVSCLVSSSVFRTNERNKKVVSRSRLPRVTCSTASQQPGTEHSLRIYFVQTVSVQAEGTE